MKETVILFAFLLTSPERRTVQMTNEIGVSTIIDSVNVCMISDGAYWITRNGAAAIRYPVQDYAVKTINCSDEVIVRR